MKTYFYSFIRRFFFLLLALCLPLAGAAAEQDSHGFDTQETCATAVLQALQNGDVEAFLSCYAIDETARSFNLSAYFEKLGALMLRNSLLQPSSKWSVARNRAKLENNLLDALAASSILLSHPDADNNALFFNPITKKNYTSEQVMSLTDTGNAFSRLVFQKLADPASLYPKYAEAFEKQRWMLDAYGMKAWEEKVLKLDLDGRAVYMPLGFVRYDGGWLLTPYAPLIAAAIGVPSYQLMIPEEVLQK